ncbi:MAG: hypothetical protein ACT4P3_14355 [Betaproteobacteria bacterium]
MAKELLNLYLNQQGQWLPGQPAEVKSQRAVNLNGANLRVHEAARSGSALLSPAGAPLAAYGDAEVYLKITYILYTVGNPACSSVRYRAFFNAHCIFERY